MFMYDFLHRLNGLVTGQSSTQNTKYLLFNFLCEITPYQKPLIRTCVPFWWDVSFMVCLRECERVLSCLDTCSSQTQHWLFLPAYKYTERRTHTLYTPRCPSKTTTASPPKFEPLCPRWNIITQTHPHPHRHPVVCCVVYTTLTNTTDQSFHFS